MMDNTRSLQDATSPSHARTATLQNQGRIRLKPLPPEVSIREPSRRDSNKSLRFERLPDLRSPSSYAGGQELSPLEQFLISCGALRALSTKLQQKGVQTPEDLQHLSLDSINMYLENVQKDISSEVFRHLRNTSANYTANSGSNGLHGEDTSDFARRKLGCCMCRNGCVWRSTCA